jgi:SAM-dependent methyltransferase
MKSNSLENKRRIQEEQYAYPYHYIPTWESGRFSQVQYWSWGYRYLGGIRVVLDQLEKISFNSLLDVGCGDGRFLREVAKRYPDATLLGGDMSERAIRLARAMNPQLHYKALDITEQPLSGRFDVATAIEVLEHIPPSNVAGFLEAIATSLKDKGWLILTVPHTNKEVSNKHYQHFTSSDLRELLGSLFDGISFVPFDVRSRVMARLEQFVGGRGEHFIVTNTRMMNWFFRLYIDRYLYAEDERKCMRIAAVCWK